MLTFLKAQRVSLALLLFAACAGSAGFDDTAVARFSYPAWFKATFYDLGEDLAEAREAGRRGVVLFFSTTGCSYCRKMLDESFADPAFSTRLRKGYHVIGLEIFSDSEITDWAGETRTLSDFAKAQGVQFSPTLVFLDLDGRRLLRLVGYYDTAFLDRALDYLESGAAEKLSLGDWVSAARARTPPGQAHGLIDDALFANPPYQLDRRHRAAQRPLLVLFEADDCGPCTEFHRQVLAVPSIRKALEDFDVVRLDAGDDRARLVTPDGAVRTAAAWHRELGFARLPALAVFDERGRKRVHTDALVRHGRFGKLLGYVRQRVYDRGWTVQRHARSESIREAHGRSTPTAPAARPGAHD